jgi:uncharacterized protein
MPPSLEGPFANLHVIDTDTHFSEPYDLWTKRAPSKYRDMVPQVREDPATGRLAWFVEDKTMMMPAGGASFVDQQGNKRSMMSIDITQGMHWEDIHASSYDVRARLEMMDKMGVWAQVLYPNTMGFGAGRLVQTLDRELARTIVSIYNEAAAEFQEGSGGRCLPMAVIPFWDIEGSVLEVRRAYSLGLRGITTAGNPHLGGLPDLGDEVYNPLWEAVIEAQFPVNIHILSTNYDAHALLDAAWPSLEKRAIKPVNSVQMELSNSRFISNIVVSDVLLRYPELRFVSVESGIGWIPYVLERVDYEYRERFEGIGEPERPPALEMFRRHIYACFWFESAGPKHLLDYLGVDNVMWESDFPHPTCLYPSPLERSAEVLGDLPADTLRKIMQDNAAQLYRVELPAG